MNVLVLTTAYCRWHYSRAIAALFALWREFVYFWFRFFSVPMLMATLVAPWRRLGEDYEEGLKPARWLETLFINLLMRLIGFVIKLLALLVWLVATLGTLATGALALAGWLMMPLFLLLSFIIGLHLLIVAF